MKQPPRMLRQAAFTLIEVTIALGVVSFALLTMIGLIPTGLGSLKNSTQQSVNSQIIQQIASGLSATGFLNRSNFSEFASTNLYFDAEAQPLDDAERARYLATITAKNPSIPGVTGADEQNLASSLKRLGISISRVDGSGVETNFYALQLSYR